MRCPKCGFISFDHIDSCLKCAKEIQETSSDMKGTTFNATSPSFLGTFSGNREPEKEQAAGDEFGEISIAASDLDRVMDEESAESLDDELSLEEIDMGASSPAGDDGEITLADVDDSMTMDLGQFEDGLDDGPAGIDPRLSQLEDEPNADLELLEDEEQDVPAMDVPDELTDITDLAAPADDQVDLTSFDEDESSFTILDKEEEPVRKDVSAPEMESEKEVSPEDKMVGDDLADLDLDGLDLDLDLGVKSTDSILPEEDILPENLSDVSLSDIDLSDTVAPVETDRKDQQDTSRSDPDLDFDLDLHGITLPDEQD